MARKKEATIKKEAGKDPKQRATEALRQEIGKRIQEMRKRSGSTALRIAEELDLTREALTQIETGRNNVSATTLWKLANLIGCEISDFFPPVQKDYALTSADVAKVAKINERAAEWAKDLWPKKGNNHDR